MSERIAIAKIVSPHGVKGELKVLPWMDNPERFERLGEVMLVNGPNVRRVVILSARVHKNMLIVTIEGISSADQAEKVRGWTFEIEHKDLLPLPEGRYYIFQLVGLIVKSVDGTELGFIKDVIQTGANDVYVVEGDGTKEILIPALKTVVKKIDLEAREMLVELPLGLLDL